MMKIKLFACHAIVYVFFICFTSCTKKEPEALPDSQAGNTLTGLKVSEVRANIAHWTLFSKTARFRDGETSIDFDTPKMFFFDNNRISSEMKAENGFLNMETKESRLEKQVEVVSKTEAINMTTSRLFFSSAKNKIWTDDPVTIYKDKTIVRGAGLTANPDLSEIEIRRQETTLPKKE